MTPSAERRQDYEVIGEPVAVPDAEALAATDPYQFQWWALGLVGARPAEQKKGADKGIDGRIYFHDEASAQTQADHLQREGRAHDVRRTCATCAAWSTARRPRSAC